MDDKGQVSIEMILIMAAVLGLAFMLFNNLTATAESASNQMNNKTNQIISKLESL